MSKDKIPQGILIHVHANDGQKKHKHALNCNGVPAAATCHLN
jgi:hypothetical protein